MFDVSFQEVFLILLVALLVVGPERLPRVARTVGLWVGRARAMFNSMRNEVEREIQLDELRKAEKELEKDLAFRKDIERELKAPVDEPGTDTSTASRGESNAPPAGQRKYPAATSRTSQAEQAASAETENIEADNEGGEGKAEGDHERKA